MPAGKLFLLALYILAHGLCAQSQCSDLESLLDSVYFKNMLCEENHQSSEQVLCTAVFCGSISGAKTNCYATPVDSSVNFHFWYKHVAVKLFDWVDLMDLGLLEQEGQELTAFMLYMPYSKKRKCSCQFQFSEDPFSEETTKFKVLCQEKRIIKKS